MPRAISRFSFVAFCLIATPLLAKQKVETTADPVGIWQWAQDYGRGEQNNWLVLSIEGEKLTGTYATKNGKTQVSEGEFKDGKFAFKLDMENERNGKPISVLCKGSISGNELKGTSEVTYKGDTTTFDLRAARTLPCDLIGTWTLRIDAEGREYTPKLIVELKDEKLKAQYVTGEYGTFDVKEIDYKKNKLRFTIFAESDRGKLDLQYEGTPVGDEIKGKLDYEVGSASGKADFDGKRIEMAKAKTP